MPWTYTLEELARVLRTAPAATNPTFHGVSTDTRTLEPGQVFFALSGEHFDGNRFVADAFSKGAVASVTTSAATASSGPCLAVERPLAALQAFAAFHRERHPIPLVALTGSCGKTTSKDLTAAVLASRYRVVKTPGNLNNDIGCPLSLLRIDEQTDVAVIEMGANHAGEIAGLCAWARPTEAAITLVAPAHLEGFGSIENVAKAKGEIVEALPKDGTFYVNADDTWCVAIAKRFSGRKILFGSRGDVVLKHCAFDGTGDACMDVAPVGTLRLPLYSRAHATNVLLAVAVGLEHGIKEFEESLRSASVSASRGAVIQVGSLQVLDDTYNANPASMKAALDALASRSRNGSRIAALGGMLELGDSAAALHRELGCQAAEAGVDHLFVRGPHATDVVAGARERGMVHAEVIEEHAAMAEAIRAVCRPGDVLLLKGSRGMRMERVLQALQAILGSEEISCSTT